MERVINGLSNLPNGRIDVKMETSITANTAMPLQFLLSFASFNDATTPKKSGCLLQGRLQSLSLNVSICHALGTILDFHDLKLD